MATNPILGELNALSPGAKAALASAHGAATSAAAAQPPKLITDPSAQQMAPAIGGGPSLPPMGGPATPPPTPTNIAPPTGTGPSLPTPAAAPITAPRGTVTGDTNELGRVVGSGSGISQIHSKIENSDFGQNHPLLGKILGWGAQIPAQLADVAGSAVAPMVTANIPGTEYNHDRLVKSDRTQLAGDVNNQEKEAQTTYLQSQPELHQAQLALKTEHENNAVQHQQDTLDATLREHGFKHDETGSLVPLDYSEMSPQQQAVTDLKGSQEELAQATAAFKKAQQANIPQQMRMAQQRIQTAQENARTAIGRLGLSRDEFNANYMGTAPGGEQLAGGTTDEATGKPIGVRVANSNNPSADRLKRSDLANNVLENTAETRKLIDQNPDFFGKMAGHITTTSQMIGSDNPALAQLGVRIHNAALASNGAHGLRSQEAIAETEQMLLNHFRNGPQATKAALDALDDSVKTFVEAAQHGKKAQPTADAMQAGGSGGSVAPEGTKLKMADGSTQVKRGGKWVSE